MRHGYSNSTERVGATVRKRYQGPDAADRQAAETAALVGLSGRYPVPTVVSSEVGELVLEFVPGVPGQELLEREPEAVLTEVGRTTWLLHGIQVGELSLPGDGPVLVHRDFAPQNMIFDLSTFAVVAVVDRELAARGDPVIDLAWPEWIVRTHHPHLAYALPTLFAGYGAEPVWAERQAAMLAKCRWAIDFVTRWSGPDAPGVRVWQQRPAATAAFSA